MAEGWRACWHCNGCIQSTFSELPMVLRPESCALLGLASGSQATRYMRPVKCGLPGRSAVLPFAQRPLRWLRQPSQAAELNVRRHYWGGIKLSWSGVWSIGQWICTFAQSHASTPAFRRVDQSLILQHFPPPSSLSRGRCHRPPYTRLWFHFRACLWLGHACLALCP